MKWMLVMLLAGCGSAPPALQRVEVPVFTPCVKVVPQRPAYEFDQLEPAATDGEIVLALARDWSLGRGYEGDLGVAIAECLRSLTSRGCTETCILLDFVVHYLYRKLRKRLKFQLLKGVTWTTTSKAGMAE